MMLNSQTVKKIIANDISFTFKESKMTDGALNHINLGKAKDVDDKIVEFKLAKQQSTSIYDLRYVSINSEKDYNNEI